MKHPKPAIGFTLVELMISLAMMVVLMLAVNFIFSSVGKATGTAQTISTINRNAQAAQTVMFNDFGQIAMTDSPCVQITSIIRPAFYNVQDRTLDNDGTFTTWDPLKQGVESNVPVPFPSQRSHRLDMMSFFARGNFSRQTGNDGEYISDMSSNEAWIWYGHLRINSEGFFNANFQDPGTGTLTSALPTGPNRDNYYATQWKLGRVPMLLIDKANDNPGGSGSLNAGGGQILNEAGVAQGFINRSWGVGSAASSNLTPLTMTSGSTSYVPVPPDSRYPSQMGRIGASRFDIAATTMSQYRDRLKSVIDAKNAGTLSITIDDVYGTRFGTDGRRFQTNPFIVKPISSAAYSQQRAVFLNSCTQFIVEFAGDFINQDPITGVARNWYGDTSPSPVFPPTDGQIDYYYDPVGKTQKIRWYGMPRKTNTNPLVTTISSANGDVAPLWDIISTFPTVAAAVLANPEVLFERTLPTANPSNDYYQGTPKLAFGATYFAAWGPYNTVRPQMIRITFVLDDADGKLGEGVNYEWVFKVQ